MRYLILLALAGCTTGPVQQIEWRELPPDQLAKACTRYISGPGKRITLDSGEGANGCYRREGNTCIVYTRPVKDGMDDDLHRTLGHETRHCFKGLFH